MTDDLARVDEPRARFFEIDPERHPAREAGKRFHRATARELRALVREAYADLSE